MGRHHGKHDRPSGLADEVASEIELSFYQEKLEGESKECSTKLQETRTAEANANSPRK